MRLQRLAQILASASVLLSIAQGAPTAAGFPPKIESGAGRVNSGDECGGGKCSGRGGQSRTQRGRALKQSTDPGGVVSICTSFSEQWLPDDVGFLTSSDLEFVHDYYTAQVIGLRFDGIDLPQTAIVNEAWIQFSSDVDDVRPGDVVLSLTAEPSASPSAFSNGYGDLTNRATTNATVIWDVDEWPFVRERASAQRTPDLSALVQEVISEGGWVEGGENSLSFLIRGEPTWLDQTDGNAARVANSGINDANSAPALTVVIAPTPTPTPAPCDPGRWIDDEPAHHFTANCTNIVRSSEACIVTHTSGYGFGSVICTDSGNYTVVVAKILARSRVAATSNGEEQLVTPGGQLLTSSSDLELTYDAGLSSEQKVGVFFPAVVFRGAQVASAHVQFVADRASDGEIVLSVSVESNTQAAAFEAGQGVTPRVRTATSVNWNVSSWLAEEDQGLAQRTPNFGAAVGEVTSLETWIAGDSDVVVMIERSDDAEQPAFAPTTRVAKSVSAVPFEPRLEVLFAHPRILAIAGDGTIVCSDDPDFVDAQGFSCEDWQMYVCLLADVEFEYTRVQIADILEACPASCNSCGGLQWAGVDYRYEINAFEGVDELGSVTDNSNRSVLQDRFEDYFSRSQGGGGSIGNLSQPAIATSEETLWNGEVTTDSAILSIPLDGSYEQLVAMRFYLNGSNALPHGAMITSAALDFTIDSDAPVNTGDVLLRIDAEASGAPTQFDPSVAFDLSTRDHTNAFQLWIPEVWSGSSSMHTQTTPDLSHVINELVRRDDWCEGDDVCSIVMFVSLANTLVPGVTGSRTALAPPRLSVSYLVPPPDLPITLTAVSAVASAEFNMIEGYTYGTDVSSDLEFTYDSGDQIVGISFGNVRIPAGSLIVHAYVQFTAKSSHEEDILLTVGLEKTRFNGDLPNVDDEVGGGSLPDRSLTDVTVDWRPHPWTQGVADTAQQTPDLRRPLQDIVLEREWNAEGGSVNIVISRSTASTFPLESIRNAHSASSDVQASMVPVLRVWYIPVEALEEGIFGTHLSRVASSFSEEVEFDFPFTESTDLELVTDGGAEQKVGLYFENIGLPAGVAIAHAHVQFQCDEPNRASLGDGGKISLVIQAEASSDAAVVSSAVFEDLHSRQAINAQVPWSPPAWAVVGEAGPLQRTPDLAFLVEELVKLPGWGMDSALHLIFARDPSTDRDTSVVRVAESGASLASGILAPTIAMAFGERRLVMHSNTELTLWAAEEESGGTVAFKHNDELRVAMDSTAALQFDGVSIVRGSLALSAHLHMSLAGVEWEIGDESSIQSSREPPNSVNLTFTMHGELAARPVSLDGSIDGGLSSRLLTSSNTTWTVEVEQYAREAEVLDIESPSITAIVDEITSQEGWAMSNSLILLVTVTETDESQAQREVVENRATSRPSASVWARRGLCHNTKLSVQYVAPVDDWCNDDFTFVAGSGDTCATAGGTLGCQALTAAYGGLLTDLSEVDAADLLYACPYTCGLCPNGQLAYSNWGQPETACEISETRRTCSLVTSGNASDTMLTDLVEPNFVDIGTSTSMLFELGASARRVVVDNIGVVYSRDIGVVERPSPSEFLRTSAVASVGDRAVVTESMRAFSLKWERARWARMIVATPTLHVDRSMIDVAYQLRDAFGRPHVDTDGLSVVLSLSKEHEVTQATVSITCESPSDIGIGSCRGAPPDLMDWFAADHVTLTRANLVVAYSDESAELQFGPPEPEMIALAAQPVHDTLDLAGVWMVVPQSPRFPGDLVTVLVKANTGGQGMASYEIDVLYDDSILEFNTVINNDANFTPPIYNHLTPGIVERISASSKTDAGVASDDVLLVSLEFSVQSDAVEGDHDRAFSGLVVSMINVVNYRFAHNLTIAAFDSRGGRPKSAMLTIEYPMTVGVFAYAAQPSLVNYAALGLQEEPHSIVVQAYDTHKGSLQPQDVTSFSTCVVTTEGACLDILPGTGCEVRPALPAQTCRVSGTDLIAAYRSFNVSVRLEVWNPTSVRVVVEDDVLQAIAGTDCSITQPLFTKSWPPAFQSTRYRVLVDLAANGTGNEVHGVDMTDFMTVMSSSSLLSASNGTVEVIDGALVANHSSPVAVQLFIEPVSDGVEAINATVSVSKAYTEVVSLDVAIVTSVEFQEISIPEILSTDPHQSTSSFVANVSLRHQLDRFDATGTVLVFGVFEDGRRIDLTRSADVEVSSLATSIIQVSRENQTDAWVVSVPDNSASECGAFVEATWDVCGEGEGSTVLSKGVANVNVALPLPIDVVVSLSVNVLTPLGDAAALMPISMPTQADIMVTVYYDDNTQRSYEQDARTIFDVVTTNVSASIIDGSNRLIIDSDSDHDQQTTSSEGRVMVRVTFPGTYDNLVGEANVSVVRFENLTVGAQPHPATSLGQKATVTELSRVQCSHEFQRARLTATAVLTDGSEFDLSSAAIFSVEEQLAGNASDSGFSLDQDRIVIAMKPGYGNFEATFGGFWTATYAIKALDERVQVTDIGILNSFGLGTTFSGVTGSGQQVAISIMFSDGTAFDSHQDVPWLLLVDLVTLTSSAPDAIEFAPDGFATLHDNFFSRVELRATANMTCIHNVSQQPDVLPVTSLHVAPNLISGQNGQIDIGSAIGLPIDALSQPGQTTSEVSIRMRLSGTLLNAFQFRITFNATGLRAKSCGRGRDWPYEFQCTTNDPLDQILFAGTASTSSAGESEIEIGVLVFESRLAGVYRIGGDVLKVETSVGTLACTVLSPCELGPPGAVVVVVGDVGDADPRGLQVAGWYPAALPAVTASRQKNEVGRIVYGDVDGNGFFDVSDVQIAHRAFAGLLDNELFEEDQALQMDPRLDGFDDQGRPGLRDVKYLLSALVGKYRFVEAFSATASPGGFIVTIDLRNQDSKPAGNATAIEVVIATRANIATIGFVDDRTFHVTDEGVIVEALAVAGVSGRYALEATGVLVSEPAVGIAFVLTTFDSTGTTDRTRIAPFYSTTLVNSHESFEKFITLDLVAETPSVSRSPSTSSSLSYTPSSSSSPSESPSMTVSASHTVTSTTSPSVTPSASYSIMSRSRTASASTTASFSSSFSPSISPCMTASVTHTVTATTSTSLTHSPSVSRSSSASLSPTSSKSESASLSGSSMATTSASTSLSESVSVSPSPSDPGPASVALLTSRWKGTDPIVDPVDVSATVQSQAESLSGDLLFGVWIVSDGTGTIMSNRQSLSAQSPCIQVLYVNSALYVTGTAVRGGAPTQLFTFIPNLPSSSSVHLYIEVRQELSLGRITLSVFDDGATSTTSMVIDDLDVLPGESAFCFGPGSLTTVGGFRSATGSYFSRFTSDIQFATVFPLPPGYPNGVVRPNPILEAQNFMQQNVLVIDRSSGVDGIDSASLEYEGVDEMSNARDGVIAFSVCLKPTRVAERYTFGYVFANHAVGSTSDATLAFVSSHSGLRMLFRDGCSLSPLSLPSISLSPFRIDDAQWHSVAVVIVGSTARVWVDGKLVSTISGFFPQGASSCADGSTFVGRRRGNQFENYVFSGSIARLNFFAFDPFDATGFGGDAGDPEFYDCPVDPSLTASISPSLQPSPSPSPSTPAPANPVVLLSALGWTGGSLPVDVSATIQERAPDISGDVVIGIWISTSSGSSGTIFINQAMTDASSPPCLRFVTSSGQVFIVGTTTLGNLFFSSIALPSDPASTLMFLEARVEPSDGRIEVSIYEPSTDEVRVSIVNDLPVNGFGMCLDSGSFTAVGGMLGPRGLGSWTEIHTEDIHMAEIYALPTGYGAGLERPACDSCP